MAALGTRLKEVTVKYGKVAIGVHIGVSALCFSGCYLAIMNSVDVEAKLHRVGLFRGDKDVQVAAVEHSMQSVEFRVEDLAGLRHGALAHAPDTSQPDGSFEGFERRIEAARQETKPSVMQAMVGSTGTFALAFLCNKALFPVRVPVTLALTPPVWRLLVRRGFKV